MNNTRYIYLIITLKDNSTTRRMRWIRCAFTTRLHATRWIQKYNTKETALNGEKGKTEFRIKQVVLYSVPDPRLREVL